MVTGIYSVSFGAVLSYDTAFDLNFEGAMCMLCQCCDWMCCFRIHHSICTTAII